MAERARRRSYREVASRQFGIIGRQDLLRDRLTPSAIWRRLQNGELEEVLPNTYRIAGSPDSWEQRLIAAQVWAGPECRISHRSAARLMNLNGFRDEVLEITAARRVRHPTVIVHHLPRLHGYDMTLKEPFLITTAARTLLDLGGVVGISRVEDALEDALRRKLTTLSALHWEIEKQGGRGHPGSKTLGKLLEVRPRTYQPTESPLEVRIDRVLRAAGLPPYIRQMVVKTRVGERRPDFAFPKYKVAVEGDSYSHHSGRRAWVYDKQRDRALRALGWELIYVTWDDLVHRKSEFVRDLSTTLVRRGWHPRR